MSKTISPGKKGAVLVVGSGIAGMQAALDCANAGLKVHLVESNPAIGGNMARLDKTFPTNDCAMCMISPKLVEVGRHLDINILTYSDLKHVEGEAGHYSVTVNRRARYVDEEKCNGCGECETECPVSVIDQFNGELADHQAIYRMYPQAIPNVFTINKTGTISPCKTACPAGVNAHGYVALISKGKYLKALDVVRERMPFASICGRICFHPCEDACNRGQVDAPVSIRNLKRFVADYEWDLIKKGVSVQREPDELPTPEKQDYSEKIAVIGAGPAGMTCADNLNRRGYQVTLFDANEKLGGMLRYGIPAYRLDRDVLDYELNTIIEQGISTKLGQRLGADFTLDQLKKEGYQSVFLATGAQQSRKLEIEGADAKGVLYGIEFLKETNDGVTPELGNKVVVIGGGNVAMDVARSALRVMDGGEVTMACLESRNEMPAHEWEIQEAQDEKITLNPSWGPHRIISENGKVVGIELIECVSVTDKDGRFNPTFNKNSVKLIKADSVILAIGQMSDLSFLDNTVESERGLILADPLTLQTSAETIFAGGDTVTGPKSLVEAVAQGHRAAESIHRYLRGEDLTRDRKPVECSDATADLPNSDTYDQTGRQDMPTIEATDRVRGFQEIETGFTEDMAIAEANRCLNCAVCSECNECVRTCKAHAINHEMMDETITFDVGAVVLANGFDLYDANRRPELGFGRYPNVVTSLQFERILSASGPYSGHIQRPGDGKEPKRIAWIQCVGSRDSVNGSDYCSSVCCMYATKQTIIAREHDSEVEATVFYIDMRSFGKGFESFYNRAKNENGTRFIRSQISSIKEHPLSHNLILRYIDTDNGKGLVTEEFDMVVLSVGLVANQSIKDTSELMGIQCDQFGFMASDPALPLLSGKEGVFLSGAVNGPKDIPETVSQSSAAAALCGELLQEARGTEMTVREYPTERDVSEEEPRIGVFVCHCGINIASVVDVKNVVDYSLSLPGVVHAENTLYTCSQDSQKKIKETIIEKRLNRLIVASCTPRTHEPLFQETLREAGLNKYLFEMADIREQCSWVHQKEPDLATSKAMDLVRGSVGKAHLLEPIHFKTVGITKAALVIGGGLSGLRTSLSMARQGLDVFLIEKSDRLGGELNRLSTGLEGQNWKKILRETIEDVQAETRIQLYLNTEIAQTTGFLGNYVTTLKGDYPEELRHGAIVIATGAKESTPEDFLFNEDDGVMTQRDLDQRLEDGFIPNNVVMIQCVGSRNETRPYCSRVCCGEAIKNALAIKAINPEANITILYRETRTYAFKELYYKKAREIGVRFIHFPDERYPVVSRNGDTLTVLVRDTVLDRDITLTADSVVLSAAIEPDVQNNQKIAEMLKLPLNEDNFFMEAHVKLRPVDFANEGVFVCGLAHSPKYTEENLSQSLAVAGRVAAILSRESLEVGGLISVVDPQKCASCLTCIRECVYEAPYINEDGVAQIEAVKCQGCGNCASACPAKAIQLRTFTDQQENALFYSILKTPELVVE